MADIVEIGAEIDPENIIRGLDEIDAALAKTKEHTEEFGEKLDEVTNFADDFAPMLDKMGELAGLTDEQTEAITSCMGALESWGLLAAEQIPLVGSLLVLVTAAWNEHVKAIEDAEKAYDNYIRKFPNSELAKQNRGLDETIMRGDSANADSELNAKLVEKQIRAGRVAMGLSADSSGFGQGGIIEAWGAGYSNIYSFRAAQQQLGIQAGLTNATQEDQSKQQKIDVKDRDARAKEMERLNKEQVINMQKYEAKKAKDMEKTNAEARANQVKYEEKQRKKAAKDMEALNREAKRNEAKYDRAVASKNKKIAADEKSIAGKQRQWDRGQEMRALRNQGRSASMGIESGYASIFNRISKGASRDGKTPEEIEKESNQLKLDWHKEDMRQRQELLEAFQAAPAGSGLAAP